MVIIEPCYGLGNTMFQYAFMCELRKTGNHACFILHKNLELEHNGFELDKIFSIYPYFSLTWHERLYIHSLELLANINYTVYKKVIRRLFNIIKTKENFIFYPEVFENKKNCLYFGTWQSPRYFQNVQTEVKKTFQFNMSQLNLFTKETIKQIDSVNSVSIHLRRGDYLKEQFKGGFSKCCPLQYYINAIDLIRQKIKNPVFFIFTNDIQYAKENFKGEDFHIVNGNKGKDSWQDMLLMSKCKHNIIANSTFSWWAAFLNENINKIIIAPKKWWYFFDHDDVVPENWTRI